ncbi:hypothetical protein BGW37DRAFT_479622 [Umbelopsis sp. PMI_123]|nr:hypothetical protein BGW37DRAFT_479622 [Umbelopsis sp. PMI_123]
MPPDRDRSQNQTFKRRKLEGDLKKRTPQRPATIPTDIYVSNKSSFAAQLARAKKLLLLQECPSITIHGLGASIEKSMQLSLKLQAELNDQVELKCTTGTVELVDDIIPEDMDQDLKTQTRNNSAVHIVVTAKPSITSIRAKARHTSRPGNYRGNKA